MYEIAKHFLQFAKELVGLGTTLQKANLEKRTRLAMHIEGIADCLTAIAVAFRERRVPNEQCGALDEYVRSLPTTCEGVVSADDIEHFQETLQMRAHARAMMSIFTDDKATEDEIDGMDRAAGQLKAFASSLRT